MPVKSLFEKCCSGTVDGMAVTGYSKFTGADSSPGSGPILVVPFHVDASAPFPMTNATLAERPAGNAPVRVTRFVPLASYKRVRILGHVEVASASASGPKCRLLYKTGAYSAVATDYSVIGTSAVEFSVFTGSAVIDTGWVVLAEAARDDVFIMLTEMGGDGIADPSIGHLQVMFR